MTQRRSHERTTETVSSASTSTSSVTNVTVSSQSPVLATLTPRSAKAVADPLNPMPMNSMASEPVACSSVNYDKLTTPSGADCGVTNASANASGGGATVAITVASSGSDRHHAPSQQQTATSSSSSSGSLQQRAPQREADEASSSSADDVEDLMHGINSFWAIVFPVSVTMWVASIAVVNYRSAIVTESMSVYLVYNEGSNGGSSGGSSGGGNFGMSLVNGLVIIGAIACLTFLMVLLYKYNCMKFLFGYIMFASMAILSWVGSQLVNEIISNHWGWIYDYFTFWIIMANFGFVGVVAIFYQKGISKFFQNGYLVLVSVILAWEFSMFPEWTTWIFCCLFACYDLCAVLTPCGPLKCLINLIQEKQAPLPGLLYEANVSDGVGNQPRQQRAAQAPVARPQSEETVRTDTSSHGSGSERQQPNTVVEQPPRPRNVDESDFATYPCVEREELIQLLKTFYRTFSPEDEWKAPQVADKFFESQDRLWLLIYHKYRVCSCSDQLPCAVQLHLEEKRRRAEEEEEDKTIKLGLGDFIFYSVLVGRAAIYDFSTFTVAYICIVLGLGGTLFLLSVLHKALPALPISIFLATAFYMWTRYVFVDFCDFLVVVPASL